MSDLEEYLDSLAEFYRAVAETALDLYKEQEAEKAQACEKKDGG